MASSQIEIAAAPHVLRDYNRRIRETERECSSKARFTFQKNIDELVRDHLNNSFGLMTSMGGNGNDENGRRSSNNVESEDLRRQTKILDRWAARQAREMITTIERQTHQAELLALSNSQTVSERASNFIREGSPARSDTSVDVPKLRASSIVQRWKEFEAEAISPRGNQLNNNSNGNGRYSRLNSIVSRNSSVGDSPMGSETDDRFHTGEGHEDSFVEWESEPTASRHLSLQTQSSDASDGVRVADIVKKLTSGSQTTQSSINSLSTCNENEHENSHEQPIACETSLVVDYSISDQGEQKDLKLNRKRLRVRGRQATKDILKQMEHERHSELRKLVERSAVSHFPHRGRIQSMLRLRFLQYGVAVHNQPHPASAASELVQLHGRSSIFDLRERFSTKAKQEDNAPILNNDNLHHTQSLNDTQESDNETVLIEQNLQRHAQLLQPTLDSDDVPILKDDNLRTRSQLQNAALDSGNTTIIDHLTSEDVHHGHVTTSERSAPAVKADHSLPSTTAQTVTVDHSMPSTSENKKQTDYRSLPSISENIEVNNCWITDVPEQGLCVDAEGPVDNERTSNDWQGDMITEETELNTTEHIGTIDIWGIKTEEPQSNTLLRLMGTCDGTWFNGISSPSKGWESHKQSWYDDTTEDNAREEEIHALHERRTVSNLLASSFRQRMDKMILLHLRKHPEIFGSVEQEENLRHDYQEMSDGSDQVASPSMQLPFPCLTPWSQYRDQESFDDQIACTPRQPTQPSSSDYQDSQQCSPFTNRPSLEMEMIYDLKGHIEKLQYEMSELRESLKSCMSMQVKLQDSIRQEVAVAVSCSRTTIQRGEQMEDSDRAPNRKGTCCICCSMQVDSLLYSCGHMCTCFKCANELQWSNGRCPICRAPIMDVVRAYIDQ